MREEEQDVTASQQAAEGINLDDEIEATIKNKSSFYLFCRKLSLAKVW